MDAISIAAAGMQNDQQRLSAISQNLANALTPAYKRVIALGASVRESFADSMETAAAGAAGASTQPMAPPLVGLALDTSAGTQRYSGNSLDIAIDGKGFLEIATGSGMAYTRQGSLHADARGRLVTVQGFPVMGTAGEITVSGSSIVIDRNGDVREADRQAGPRIAGRIKLVQFDNPGALTPLGDGRYSQGAAQMVKAETDTVLRGGYLENSNVNPAQEMVRLSETLRHFESMQKLVQGYDDVLEKSIRKLGEF